MRKRIKVFLGVLLLCVLGAGLSACGGASDPGSPALAGAKPVPKTIPKGKARVELRRIESILYVGLQATVEVNGQKRADIWSNSKKVIDIKPGATTIKVSGWSYPGAYSAKINTKPGKRYVVEIAPRGASFLPSATLGILGGAIDASVNENAGAFQVRILGEK